MMVVDYTRAQMQDVLRQNLKENLTMIIQMSPRSHIYTHELRSSLHLVNTSTII